MSHWFKRAKEAVHLVGVVYTLGSVVALAIEVVAPHGLTTSHTLRWWISAGAIIGGIIGYFRTAFAFAGTGRQACLAAGKKYLIRLVFFFVLLVLPVLNLDPRIAEKYQFLRAWREGLIAVMLLTNVLEGLIAAFAAFFFVGAVVVCSPDVANPRGGIYK